MSVGCTEKSKQRTRKKKESFKWQVKTGLGQIIQERTLKHIPNRKYEKYLKEKKESDVARI